MNGYCDRPYTREDSEFFDGTYAGLRERAMGLGYDLGMPGLLASVDQVDAKLRDHRELILFGELDA